MSEVDSKPQNETDISHLEPKPDHIIKDPIEKTEMHFFKDEGLVTIKKLEEEEEEEEEEKEEINGSSDNNFEQVKKLKAVEEDINRLNTLFWHLCIDPESEEIDQEVFAVVEIILHTDIYAATERLLYLKDNNLSNQELLKIVREKFNSVVTNFIEWIDAQIQEKIGMESLHRECSKLLQERDEEKSIELITKLLETYAFKKDYEPVRVKQVRIIVAIHDLNLPNRVKFFEKYLDFVENEMKTDVLISLVVEETKKLRDAERDLLENPEILNKLEFWAGPFLFMTIVMKPYNIKALYKIVKNFVSIKTK